ncbi:hypothetical protein ABH922_005206 [Rhodococcus sp. 27YEA15]|jgi:hypothetical protein
MHVGGNPNNRRADGNRIPGLEKQGNHSSSQWRWQFDYRLRCFDFDEDLVQSYNVPDGNRPGHQLGIVEPLSKIWKSELCFLCHVDCFRLSILDKYLIDRIQDPIWVW